VDDPELADVDVLLCLLVAQIARHQKRTDRGDVNWVSMSAVEALCQRLGHLGAAAVERGWHTSASNRGLLDVRGSPSGPQVRLVPSVASSVGVDLESQRLPHGGRVSRLLDRLLRRR
jgi:hypothetical protein